MARDRAQNIAIPFGEMAAADTFEQAIYFKKPMRIAQAWGISEEAEAAHATQVLRIQFGTAADPDAYADLTNDSDITTAGVIVSSAWVADTVKARDFEADAAGVAGRPGSFMEVPAGVLLITVSKAAGTAAGRVTAGLRVFESD